MRINKHESKILVDVDQTLVFWDKGDKWRRQGVNKKKFNYYGMDVYLRQNTYIIQLVKAYHDRGFYIQVCSNNGWQWALEVVKRLDLRDFVHEVGTKFNRYVDDKPASEWAHHVKVSEINP